MDPLAVTVSVATLTASGLTTVRALSTLSSRFQHAIATISAILGETTTLFSYLSHIQQLLLINAPGVHDTSVGGVDLRQAVDAALTGCVITYSCLDEEIRQINADLIRAANSNGVGAGKRIWKDEIMTEILQQIREQQAAMALLVSTLQMQSLSASNHFLSENRALLLATASRSRSLCVASYPRLKVPDSIFDSRSEFLERASTISGAEFDFDSDIVNSTVYKRAMAGAVRQDPALLGVPRRKMSTGSSGNPNPTAGGGKERDDVTVSRTAQRTSVVNAVHEARERDRSRHRKQPSGHSEASSATRHSRKTSTDISQSGRPDVVSPDTILSVGATVDTNSQKSPNLSAMDTPDTSASDRSAVNFSRKPDGTTLNSQSSIRTDSMNEFYDDTSVSSTPEMNREPAQSLPIRVMNAKRNDAYSQRGAMPHKAARRLGVDDRPGTRLAHIDENPGESTARPMSVISSVSAGSKGSKGKERPVPPQRSAEELARIRGPLDWSAPWSVFWGITAEEIKKPPHGYSIGLQELWWKVLTLEENVQHSLELLHTLITSDNMSLPTCGITPLAVRKIQISHDKYLRQPLRQAMGVGPWTFDYPAVVKAYQSAHAHLVPLYERYSWDLPLVTFQVAASSAPASSASRDLLLSIGPGMPTRYTCLRSPLTHICATFDTIQALYDGMYKGGRSDVPNFAQIVEPVREQLRSLIASCNRNILLRWDDLRRSNLFGSNASRDITQVTKELVFPPSQRRNMNLLNLSSPTRAVISRADLHWKAKLSDSWSKCHAILLNNYLVLASTSSSKSSRQHQIYYLIALDEIATTIMSADASLDKASSKRPKPGKPVYHLIVRTAEFEHILGFATMVHCLEWHEHLDVALRGEMMDMPTGIISTGSM